MKTSDQLLPCLFLGLLLVAVVPGRAQMTVPLTIASASGQSQVFTPGKNEPVLAAAGMEVPLGAELRTGDNGEITLIVFPRLAITLKGGTRLRVEERHSPTAQETATATVDLPEGRIVVLVSDPPAGQQAGEVDLQIRTPQGVARPRGTFYAVLVKDGKSYLAVREGMVGLEQFQPLQTEAAATDEKLPVRNYGAATTTSPRG
ncbi:MAG: FecR domain-containing protein [Candidatus Methylacidiphilales bacterium]|nr:FecR domain-containing protein [Candidatus Methylacidiphilales bacterium]